MVASYDHSHKPCIPLLSISYPCTFVPKSKHLLWTRSQTRPHVREGRKCKTNELSLRSHPPLLSWYNQHIMVDIRSNFARMYIRINKVRIVAKGDLLVLLKVFMARSTIISDSATATTICIFDSSQAGRPWHLSITAFVVAPTFFESEDVESCAEMAQNQGNLVGR